MTARAADSFKLGLVQMSCGPQPEANVAKALSSIRRAARQGAQIVCLQELFRTPYFCQRQDPALFDLAEPIPGPTSERIAQVARKAGAVVVASLFERRSAGLYHNTAVVFDADGDFLGLYRKTHIPDDPLYFEKYYFTPGDLGFRVFQTHFGRVGVLVCWDQWFPEAARLTALRGAEVLVYPTAIGWHPREKAEHGPAQRSAWETVQRAHAIANGVFVAAVNRVGHEGPADGGLEFWGSSFVCDPFGVMLQQAPVDREDVLVVDCDRRRLEDVRRNWPFLRDRRVDAYADLSHRWLG
jgi:N-carbamoylputrescine amidase